jgi:hypothetical protein
MAITPYVNDYIASANAQGQKATFVGVEVNPSSGVEYIPVVYGLRRVEGIRLYTYVTGTDLYCAFALSEGYCRGMNAIYIDNNKLDIDLATLTHRTPITVGSGPYAGILTIEFIDGRGSAHPYAAQQVNVGASQLLALAGKTVNYTNLCYIVCKFVYSGASSPYKNVPTVGVDLFGRFIPHYLTGSISNTYNANPGWILWDLLQHPLYGNAITQAQIDSASFTTVINACDTQVTRGTVRYSTFTANWIMNTGTDYLQNIQILLETFNMSLNLVQGKWTVSIEASPSSSDGSGGGLTFDESSIIGDINIQYPNLNERYNKVIVEYPDKDNNFQMKTTQYPDDSDTTFLTEDGNKILSTRITSNLVTDYYHANDIAQMTLRKSRGQILYRFTATKQALRCRVGDFIFINTTYPLINNQKCVVISMSMNADLTIDMECALYSTGFYPATFSNIVKAPGVGTQVVSGTTGIISTPVRSPILPPEPLTLTAYEVSSNQPQYNEGQTIVFTVNTTLVPDGTVINYALRAGNVQPTTADVSGASLTGTLTINSNTATVSFVLAQDALTEGDEYWQFAIFLGTVFKAFCYVTVKDTSLAPPPPKYRYTITGMPTFGNGDWYIGWTNAALTAYDATETTALAERNVRTKISKYQYGSLSVFTTSVYDIEVNLIDRLTSGIGKTKQIFVLHELTTAGSLQYLYTKRYTIGTGYPSANYVYQFNYTNPPTGVNQLKATQLSPTINVQPELITGVGRLSPIAGATRMYPVSGRDGHYSNSGLGTIRVMISHGSNPNAVVQPGYETHTVDRLLSSAAPYTIKLRFVELDPITNLFTEIGTKDILLSLTTSAITAKYLDVSRTNIVATSKTTSPF